MFCKLVLPQTILTTLLVKEMQRYFSLYVLNRISQVTIVGKMSCTEVTDHGPRVRSRDSVDQKHRCGFTLIFFSKLHQGMGTFEFSAKRCVRIFLIHPVCSVIRTEPHEVMILVVQYIPTCQLGTLQLALRACRAHVRLECSCTITH